MPFNQKPQKFNAKINTVTVGTGDKAEGRKTMTWKAVGIETGKLYATGSHAN